MGQDPTYYLPGLFAKIWQKFTGEKPNSITLAGSKLVRGWSQTGSKSNSITLSGSNQLRTSSEPDSV